MKGALIYWDGADLGQIVAKALTSAPGPGSSSLWATFPRLPC